MYKNLKYSWTYIRRIHAKCALFIDQYLIRRESLRLTNLLQKHEETNWRVSYDVRTKYLSWHSFNKRGLSGTDSTTEILLLNVDSIWLCQSVQQGSHKSRCSVVLSSRSPMHRTCGALSLWEWNMWGRACNAALHPHESRNMIRLFHIANSRCVSIEMTTLFIQETSHAVR